MSLDTLPSTDNGNPQQVPKLVAQFCEPHVQVWKEILVRVLRVQVAGRQIFQ